MSSHSKISILCFFLILSLAAFAAPPTPGAQNSQKKKLMSEEEWFQQQFEEQQKDMDQLFDGFLFDDPFEGLQKMRERMEQAFGKNQLNDKHRSLFGLSSPDAWITSHDEDQFEVYQLDTNKIDKEKLEIKIQNGMLTIKAVGKNSKPSQQGWDMVQEMQQSFSIPEGVQDSDVKIEEKGHVLEIRVPRFADHEDTKKPANKLQPEKKPLKSPTQKFEI